MKKIKLLSGLVGINALVASVVPTITSCSCGTVSHIKVYEEGKIKELINGVAYYFIVLDNDQYKTNEFSVKLLSRNNADVSDIYVDSAIATNNVLTVKVKTTKSYSVETIYNFDMEVKSSTWTEKLENFVLTVPADAFDGQVTQQQWANAIDLLVSENENFTANGKYSYTNPDETKSYTYTFENKYNSEKSEQILVGHPQLGSQTVYMDKYYDVYWTYFNRDGNWIGDYPYIEKFGFDDYYYFVSLLADLKDMKTSGMEFISSEPGGIGYYYGSTTYSDWTIEYGFKFNNEKVIDKTEIRATRGQEVKDTVATYSNYKTTSFTIPLDKSQATYNHLTNMKYNAASSKYVVRTKYLTQDYYVLPLEYTDDMPDSTIITSLKGFRGGRQDLPLTINGAYAFVDGVMQEATIAQKVATFANPITIEKGGSAKITFVLWFDEGHAESDIELVPLP